MPRPKSTKSIEERLDYIDDYIEILQLINCYGPAADSTHWELIKEIWAEDCIYEVGGLGIYNGHKGLEDAFFGEFHQGLMKSGSGHVSSMPHIVIEGDRASATHHATTYKQVDGKFPVIRLLASRWELERRMKGWVVIRRTNELLQENSRARELLARVKEGPTAA
ncbi:nuclear transport factor 2 family protein [Paraburkholderia strydomiana]|uniref:nuclear transport factor 2 family protein n=1 Tax=Paraburkholderia strydomiana TaxID=1245417 RepID=UPI0038B9D040